MYSTLFNMYINLWFCLTIYIMDIYFEKRQCNINKKQVLQHDDSKKLLTCGVALSGLDPCINFINNPKIYKKYTVLYIKNIIIFKGWFHNLEIRVSTNPLLSNLYTQQSIGKKKSAFYVMRSERFIDNLRDPILEQVV